MPGVELGDWTIVGAGSVVTKSFKEGYCVIGGIPATIIKSLEKDRCMPFGKKKSIMVSFDQVNLKDTGEKINFLEISTEIFSKFLVLSFLDVGILGGFKWKNYQYYETDMNFLFITAKIILTKTHYY